jgi:predicted metalloprotease with PDZ domain
MTEYLLRFNAQTASVLVEISFKSVNQTILELLLPAWRPGRYQLQNYAKHIRKFKAYNHNGDELNFKKKNRNCWQVFIPKPGHKVKICYEYVCTELNAGSSWIDADLVYLNPINFTLYRNDDLDQSHKIIIEHAKQNQKTASGLDFYAHPLGFRTQVKNLYEWFDSPILISKNLNLLKFTAKGVPFYFSFYGKLLVENKKLCRDLGKIAKKQIELFGAFPESDYHFLLIIPQQAYYHGVEHTKSTILVLSAQGNLTDQDYDDILSLSSHELFHAWNIAKIRPKELLPYDFSKEQYFDTCFVAEGFTTYYGDRMIWDAGVWSEERYFFEFETNLRRHFEKNDGASQSLLESSIDLWVDGYEAGIPLKKVSVYDKGAIVAFILDVAIRKATHDLKNLNHVMQKLWELYGNMQKGYSYTEVKNIISHIAQKDLNDLVDKLVAGNGSIFEDCQVALKYYNRAIQFSKEGMLSLKLIKQNKT